VSRFHEPVIGDDLDLETYGRPAVERRELGASRSRTAVRHERSDYRADDQVRTVKIKGQATPARRSSTERSIAFQLDRYDRRPDRAAQWALFMGVFMVVVAIVTGT